MNAVSRARSIVGGHRLPGGPVAKSLEMHRVETELIEICCPFGCSVAFFRKW